MLNRYRHYKGGFYRVLHDDARMCYDSDLKVVIYQSEVTGVIWVRKHSEFFEKVPGTDVLRFTPIGDGDVR